VSDRFRPFCSERCKTLDLGHWLSGSYRVPVRQDQDGETDIPEGAHPRRADTDDEP
jgi:endogenous inhibitor of DNA gyrase (YacG/DUF329 family)